MSKHKKIRYIIHYVKPTGQLLFKIRFSKGGPTCRRQVVNPRHQTPHMDNQLQSLKLLCRIESWVARCDIKGSVSTMLNPILSKKVQGQKYPFQTIATRANDQTHLLAWKRVAWRHSELGPLLLIWINSNPSMDKKLYPLWSVGWNYLSIIKLQWCNLQSLE